MSGETGEREEGVKLCPRRVSLALSVLNKLEDTGAALRPPTMTPPTTTGLFSNILIKSS